MNSKKIKYYNYYPTWVHTSYDLNKPEFYLTDIRTLDYMITLTWLNSQNKYEIINFRYTSLPPIVSWNSIYTNYIEEKLSDPAKTELNIANEYQLAGSKINSILKNLLRKKNRFSVCFPQTNVMAKSNRGGGSDDLIPISTDDRFISDFLNYSKYCCQSDFDINIPIDKGKRAKFNSLIGTGIGYQYTNNINDIRNKCSRENTTYNPPINEDIIKNHTWIEITQINNLQIDSFDISYIKLDVNYNIALSSENINVTKDERRELNKKKRDILNSIKQYILNSEQIAVLEECQTSICDTLCGNKPVLCQYFYSFEIGKESIRYPLLGTNITVIPIVIIGFDKELKIWNALSSLENNFKNPFINIPWSTSGNLNGIEPLKFNNNNLLTMIPKTIEIEFKSNFPEGSEPYPSISDLEKYAIDEFFNTTKRRAATVRKRAEEREEREEIANEIRNGLLDFTRIY